MPSKAKRLPTSFEQRVYDRISTIPKGKVTTYKLLAKALNCNSAQAIGQALKRNPYAPDVPCHRVIRSDFTLGGYAGKTQGAKIHKKLKLLAEENIKFDSSGTLLDKEIKIYSF